MRFSKSIWTDRSIEIWNSFKRQLYLFFLPPIIKSLAYTHTYALCLSLHAKPREINSSQISKFLPARVILQRGTRVLQAQTCRVHTHKYLKKYGGFRSRALPCPLADIYCRARFKNAFRAQKGTTVNGSTRARARARAANERERAEEFVPICLKALCSCQWVEAARERMHARNERSTLFSCARITICSIRSRQSLKLFDARGLSISLLLLLRPPRAHVRAALSTAFRVLIMNIVFYDPAFSFVSRFFLFFFFPPLVYDFPVTDENHERVFFSGTVLMTDVDRYPR